LFVCGTAHTIGSTENGTNMYPLSIEQMFVGIIDITTYVRVLYHTTTTIFGCSMIGVLLLLLYYRLHFGYHCDITQGEEYYWFVATIPSLDLLDPDLCNSG
jgi:hypothetical protein